MVWPQRGQSSLVGTSQVIKSQVEPTVSEEKCPVCGRNLVERESKFGPFLGCPGYPECTFTIPRS